MYGENSTTDEELEDPEEPSLRVRGKHFGGWYGRIDHLSHPCVYGENTY